MTNDPEFYEIGAKTNFSFLEGAARPEEMVVSASVLGLSGLGIADRNSVAGVVRAYNQVCEMEETFTRQRNSGDCRIFDMVARAREPRRFGIKGARFWKRCGNRVRTVAALQPLPRFGRCSIGRTQAHFSAVPRRATAEVRFASIDLPVSGTDGTARAI